MGPRCRVKDGDEYTFGEFLGLVYSQRDENEIEAIVRLDGHGLFLTARHPSRVELIPEFVEPAAPSREVKP